MKNTHKIQKDVSREQSGSHTETKNREPLFHDPGLLPFSLYSGVVSSCYKPPLLIASISNFDLPANRSKSKYQVLVICIVSRKDCVFFYICASYENSDNITKIFKKSVRANTLRHALRSYMPFHDTHTSNGNY